MKTIDRIAEFIEVSKISKNAFDMQIGAGNGYIGKLIQKRGSVGSDIIENIFSAFPDLNPIWLLTGKGYMINKSYKQIELPSVNNFANEEIAAYGRSKEKGIPLYELEASAGIVSLFMDSKSEQPVDYIRIPNLPKCDGAVYVAGDSMYPLLKTRDVVMYKKIDDIQNHIFIWGEMYLVAFENSGDDYVTVKWMQKSKVGSDHICLVSENRHHEPIDVPKKNIRALAVIKASLRINSMQ